MKRVIVLSAALCFCSLLFANDIVGAWSGTLNVSDASMRLILHIQQTDEGYSATMDSPDQAATGIVMSHVSYMENRLIVELRVAGMKYEGTLNGDVIHGTFAQAGQVFPLDLNRISTQPVRVDEETEAVSVFEESDLRLKTSTGTIYATLTLPKTDDSLPVALIVAGSGPTDRNGNNPSMTHNAYKMLAHELANRGIASLRYDKRGIAHSAAAVESEDQLRFDDYVNDARAWLELLAADGRFSQCVVIGHSEGSLVGMLAADKADKMISISGPGRSADELLKEQLKAYPEALRAKAYPAIDRLAAGERVHMDAEMQKESLLVALFRPAIQPYLISWFAYKPQEVIRDMTIPVLIVQGTTDIQVPVEEANRLKEAQPKAHLCVLDGMNHVLKTAPNDRSANLATYNQPELPLTDGLVERIVQFIASDYSSFQ